ncbi:GDP-L-fucose synthase family protein [uncultured Enterovirga sp.]|uniref:GDP-L-fucose synthase family protein n=1 Tax=uncultured Enterovirga sp. TaxID=2026352 RepID=UPI0035CB88D0
MSEGRGLAGLKDRRVFVAGQNGMVGSALVRRLASEACVTLTASRGQLDLRDGPAVRAYFSETRPDIVILAAAKVGGIEANRSFPVDFLMDNLAIEQSVIRAAHEAGVQRLLFLGSSCIYPKLANQPMTEDELLTGPLEPTNEWYAIAKIAGIKMCQAYRRQYGCDFFSAMPTNLYGPGDNYHPEHSHVPAALIRRFHEAKEAGAPNVTVWGTGTPRREFLFVDDLADACVFLLERPTAHDIVNVGVGEDVSIADFASLISSLVGYRGEIRFDTSKPDGTPRKLLDVSRLAEAGWKARTPLSAGLGAAIRDFVATQGTYRDGSRRAA